MLSTPIQASGISSSTMRWYALPARCSSARSSAARAGSPSIPRMTVVVASMDAWVALKPRAEPSNDACILPSSVLYSALYFARTCAPAAAGTARPSARTDSVTAARTRLFTVPPSSPDAGAGSRAQPQSQSAREACQRHERAGAASGRAARGCRRPAHPFGGAGVHGTGARFAPDPAPAIRRRAPELSRPPAAPGSTARGLDTARGRLRRRFLRRHQPLVLALGVLTDGCILQQTVRTPTG